MDTKKILASKKTERWLIVAIVVTFLLSLFLSSINPNKVPDTKTTQQLVTETRSIQVAENTYTVLIADSSDERILGLSNRDSLPDGVDGMLFIFDEPNLHSIWMKDMNFSIDILWLDADFNIIDQALNTSPDTYPESFTPSIPALYVLELPA